MNKDGTNYVILTEKMLNQLVNSRKMKFLYLIVGAEALVIWKQHKKVEQLQKDADYWQGKYDEVIES